MAVPLEVVAVGAGEGTDSMLWNIYSAGLPQRVLKLFSWPPRSHRGRSPYRTSLAVSICLRPSAFVSPWLGSSEHLHAGGDQDARLSSRLCSVNEADGAAEIRADGWFLSSVQLSVSSGSVVLLSRCLWWS